jgi:hypothetical protein
LSSGVEQLVSPRGTVLTSARKQRAGVAPLPLTPAAHYARNAVITTEVATALDARPDSVRLSWMSSRVKEFKTRRD